MGLLDAPIAPSTFSGLAKEASQIDVVKVPFSGSVSLSTSGAGVASLNKSSSGVPNPDGSGSKVTLQTTASALPDVSIVRDQIWGRAVGVRWLRNNVASLLPFDVVIDGVAYGVDEVVQTRRNNVIVTSITDTEALMLLVTNLARTIHTAEIHLTGDPAVAKSIDFYGWLGEAGQGYDQTPKTRAGNQMTAQTVLTAALATILYNNYARGLSFFNADTVQRTVTVTNNTGTGGADATYKVIDVPAGRSTQIDFLVPKNLSGWKWKADVAGVVSAWPEVTS